MMWQLLELLMCTIVVPGSANGAGRFSPHTARNPPFLECQQCIAVDQKTMSFSCLMYLLGSNQRRYLASRPLQIDHLKIPRQLTIGLQ